MPTGTRRSVLLAQELTCQYTVDPNIICVMISSARSPMTVPMTAMKFKMRVVLACFLAAL